MSYSFRKFKPDTDVLKPFDCGHADLNGFLLETTGDIPNATTYDQQLLAATYVVEDDQTHDILAYFSLLHDKLEREFVNPTNWNRVSRKISNSKRRSSYPALKIGRLAVGKQHSQHGIGTHIIRFVEAMYLINKQAGCRFITVDAIPSAVDFYKKCKFFTLKEPDPVPEGVDVDELDQTTLMGFDLKSF